jgi:hypothetical protein
LALFFLAFLTGLGAGCSATGAGCSTTSAIAGAASGSAITAAGAGSGAATSCDLDAQADKASAEHNKTTEMTQLCIFDMVFSRETAVKVPFGEESSHSCLLQANRGHISATEVD